MYLDLYVHRRVFREYKNSTLHKQLHKCTRVTPGNTLHCIYVRTYTDQYLQQDMYCTVIKREHTMKNNYVSTYTEIYNQNNIHYTVITPVYKLQCNYISSYARL